MLQVDRATAQLVQQLNTVLFENFLQSYCLSKKLLQTSTMTKLDMVDFLKQTVREEQKVDREKVQIRENYKKLMSWKLEKKKSLRRKKTQKLWQNVGNDKSIKEFLEFEYGDFVTGDYLQVTPI